jgi:uncharacterized protein
MHEKIKPFVVLQELDSKRRALKRSLEEQLRRREAAKADLKAAEASKAKADEAKKIREKHLMDAQLRLKSAEERRAKTEDRLGKISNAKEFAAMQEQAASAKTEVSTLEEETLELMEAVEGVRRDAEFAAKALREQADRTSRVEAETAKDGEAALERLKALDAEVKAAEASCDGGMLEEYKRLVGRPGGIAVAAVENGVCQGCYTKLTPQTENLLMANAVVQCGTCRAFLAKN